MRFCVVPNCDRLHNNEKRPMFFPPKEPVRFAKWKESLALKKELKRTDRICIYHFKADCVLTKWSHNINGEENIIERDKKKLNLNAIPTINLTIAKPPNIKRKPYTRRSSITKVVVKEEINEGNPIQSDNLTSDNNLDLFEEIYDEILQPVPNEKNLNADEVPEMTKIENANSTKEKTELFEEIYDDIYEIVLPNQLWGMHRDPERRYLAFSCFNAEISTTEKCLILDDNLTLKISIKGVVVRTEDMKDVNINVISDILSDLDESELPLSRQDEKM